MKHAKMQAAMAMGAAILGLAAGPVTATEAAAGQDTGNKQAQADQTQGQKPVADQATPGNPNKPTTPNTPENNHAAPDQAGKGKDTADHSA